MPPKKRALIVGIDEYDSAKDLGCSVADAEEMQRVLSRHEDRSINFQCNLLTSDKKRITLDVLKQEIERWLSEPEDDVLFYFSGHGHSSETGSYLYTQECGGEITGYPMSDLLAAVNALDDKRVFIILDCCHAGGIGIQPGVDEVSIGEGVTIISSSSAGQVSEGGVDHSLFTELVLAALEGGAADVRGFVSAAAIYGFVEQALGAWKQRPMYRSNARELTPVRRCEPRVPDHVLFELTTLFKYANMKFQMNPSFEHTYVADSTEAEFPGPDPANIEIFNQFKVLRDGGLLRTSNGEDLYFAALNQGTVELTPLGKFYWRLVSDEVI